MHRWMKVLGIKVTGMRSTCYETRGDERGYVDAMTKRCRGTWACVCLEIGDRIEEHAGEAEASMRRVEMRREMTETRQTSGEGQISSLTSMIDDGRAQRMEGRE